MKNSDMPIHGETVRAGDAMRTAVDALNEHDPDGLVIDNTVTEGAVILLAQLDGELE